MASLVCADLACRLKESNTTMVRALMINRTGRETVFRESLVKGTGLVLSVGSDGLVDG